MPTAVENATVIQDKVFNNLQVGQRAVIDMVRSWAETVELVFSKVPELPVAEQAVRPTQLFETGLGFTERVVASQREFANRLFEAAMPASRAPANAASTAAQAAKTGTSKV